ncbi:TetR/AcrR family transcriptional regulator [Methylocaldum sp. BRCS4]|jgi:TetR/AcrR family transcriptional repressor of nem operon|uniref:TetR/AcrR family transcriptional regulator n=1 Tax=Methylocaldum sp. GT1BB TaxID=3438963 RepID=UPI0012EC2928|nr:TetR/AcrR family transcriptional regulator [Methylocaldum sp. BRCS4]
MKPAESLDTRDRLLQTAAALMWERSFQATGVDELCQRANAKKGSFYHFFPSKSDLAVAAMESFWEHARAGIFEPVFSGSESGLTQLRELIERIHELQVQVSAEKGGVLGCPFGNLGQEMARQDEKIREALQKIFDSHCQFIEAALVRAEQAGEIPAGDNRQRAKNIFALLEGALLLAKVANDPQIFRRVISAVTVVAAA